MKKRLAIVLSVLLLLSLMPVSVAAVTGETVITVGPEGEEYSYNTIQAAIDAASAGGTITVAAGTYEEQLVINKPLTLIGPNEEILGYSEDRVAEAIITYPGTTTDTSELSLLRVNSDNVTVKGFFFKNHQPNQEYKSQDEVLFVGANSVFENNRIELHVYKKGLKIIGTESTAESSVGGALVKGNRIEGLNTRTNTVYIQGIAGTIENNVIISEGVGIQIQPYKNTIGGIVRNNTISGAMYSVWHNYAIEGAGKWTYENNTIAVKEPSSMTVYPVSQLTWRGIFFQTASPNTELLGNVFDGSNAFNQDGSLKDKFANSIAFYFANVSATSTINIHDNTITNVNVGAEDLTGYVNLQQILEANTFPAGSAVVGSKILVAPYNENKDTYYPTIQAAIDASSDEDTIIIPAGTYDETIVVPEANVKSVTILGANSDTVPSSSAVDGTIITGGMTFGRDISSNPTIEKSITVKGITFSGGSGLSFKDIRNVTVENNKFIGITSSDGAITVLDPSNHDRAGVTTIKNNYIDGVAGTSNGLGIYVRRPAPTTVIENNHIEDTDFNSIQVVGVSSGPDVTISENTLINWDQDQDTNGGRAIRINFDPVDAETALSVIGNTFEPNDNSAPVDADYVKITGVSTVDNAVENLIDSLIWQNTWPNGTNYSTVILVNSTTGPDLELPFSEEGPDTITIEPGESVTLTVADNNQEEINVIVPIELIQYLDQKYLDQNQMGLEIETPFGRISIAAEDLGDINSETDLEFIVNPSTNSEAPTIEELADLMAAADINTDLTGKEIVVIGLPLIVTSDIYNVEVSLIIPLADYDEGEVYYVYVEHSDGEEVLVPGTVVDFGDGKGIQITVNRFSTFTVLALEDEVPEETTETSATEGTSETSATETTETSPTEESTEESSEASDGDGETLPKTGESAPVIPYLMIVLAGLALAISIRIRLANGKHVD